MIAWEAGSLLTELTCWKMIWNVKQAVNVLMAAKAAPDLRNKVLMEGHRPLIKQAWAAQVESGGGPSYADLFDCSDDKESWEQVKALEENWDLLGTAGPSCPAKFES